MGSSLVTGLETLTEVLAAAELLADVRILDRRPSDGDDVVSEDASMTSVFLDGVELDHEIVTMQAGVVEYEETVSLTLVVQHLDPEGEQIEVMRRCEDVYDAVRSTLANNPTLGLDSSDGFRRFEATVRGAEFTFGRLPNGHGHGARYDVAVEFVARVDA